MPEPTVLKKFETETGTRTMIKGGTKMSSSKQIATTLLHKRIVGKSAVLFCLLLITEASVLSGQNTKGWPRASTTTGQRVQLQSSAALYDLNGDGKLEIIVPRLDDKLYVYEHDGRIFQPNLQIPTNYPVTLGFLDGTFSSPAIGDVDGDGVVEIVIAGDDKEQKNASIKIFEIDGSAHSQTISLSSVSLASGKASPCLIDCIRYESTSPFAAHPALEILFRDGDGQLHIVQKTSSGFTDLFQDNTTWKTVSNDTQKDRAGRQFITASLAAISLSSSLTYLAVPSTDGQIHHWEILSSPSTGQTFVITKQTSISTNLSPAPVFSGSAALAILDGDGEADIVAGDSLGNVYIWNGSNGGQLRSGWPKTTNEGISASPALADIDNDNSLDVIIGSEDSKVYVWNKNGTPLSGWPFETRGDILAAPVVANLDGSDELEVVIASADRSVYIINSAGVVWSGWPKKLNSTLYATPAIADLRNSGKASIVLGEYDGLLYCFDLPFFVGEPGKDWKQFLRAPSRTGSN